MTKLVWVCMANYDSTEGRSPHKYDVCFASSRELALKIVNHPSFYRKHGVMGCKPYDGGQYDVEEREVSIYESFDEFTNHTNPGELIENRKKIALSKLTDEEKQLLGLK